jgi:penicillin-binding protein 1A
MNRRPTPAMPSSQKGFLNPNIAKFIAFGTLGVVLAGILLLVFAVLFINPRLPSLDAITDYRPKIPLRIYSADNVLLGEFGEEKRSMVKLDAIPQDLKNAVLAVEDARFYEHSGVDYIGIMRAIATDILHASAKQGASTITMQVARNVFLTRQKTISRKLYEVLLANKIENALTKDQILEVYMNHIYLGQRAYGFAAAAQTYYGKNLKDITLAEAAMLAGLPKAPSAYNPIVNPKRAHIRQQHILRRMLELGFITQQDYDTASVAKLETRTAGSPYSVHAEYAAEMVRQMMYEQYQENTYTQGIVVHTTINAAAQEAAYDAVRKGVIEYDRRHGYRGPEALITLPSDAEERIEAIDTALDSHPDQDTLLSAVVTEASPKKVTVMMRDGETMDLTGASLTFVAAALKADAKKDIQIKPGSVIRLWKESDKRWHISQLPQVEAALVSLTPQTGGIRALVGGFDFNKNHFNHVTQAWRQPGSVFKPFVYSAALEKGFAPASVINDAPVSFVTAPGEPAWEPKNDGEPLGPVTLRTAVQRSINFVAIRTLDAIGAQYAQDFITEHFGFDRDKIPAYLSMALGAGQTTPLQLSAAYATLANGGYTINPYLIERVTDANGNMLSKSTPQVAGQNAPRAIDERNSYMITSMLRSAAQQGTGALTNSLRRGDLAGKTGTTNNAVDGWFAGYQNSLATVVWMGYDQPKSLGGREFGSRLALPIWVDYMKVALKGVPEYQAPVPAGIDMINGEMYYSEFTPGNGLVNNLGVTVTDAIADFFGWGSSKKDESGHPPESHSANEPSGRNTNNASNQSSGFGDQYISP